MTAATRAAVLALDPAAREALLGLPGWQRALYAAHRAGLAGLVLVVPDEATAADARARCARDARLAGVDVRVAGQPGDPLADPAGRGSGLLVLDGAAVVDEEAVRALAEGAAAPPPRGLFVPAGAPRGEKARRLLRALANPHDGLVDTWINRPISRWFTRALAPTGVSPNAITVASAVIGLAGAALLAAGRRDLALAGALVFQLSAAVDCTDGEVARLTYRSSPIGARLDLALDNVVHLAVFLAIAWAARGRLGDVGALAAGLLTVVGALVCFVLVWRLTFAQVSGGSGSPRLKALLDRMTNRDFSVAVIFFAAIDRLEVLLLLMAVGTHLFWLGLVLAARGARPGATG